MAAGIGRLANVIVKDQNAAKDILSSKVLKYRVTFLPLNKL